VEDGLASLDSSNMVDGITETFAILDRSPKVQN